MILAALIGLGTCSAYARDQGRDVPVPSSCSLGVNVKLQQMIRDHPKGYVENVMACGIATGTRVNYGGPHGSHHVITLNVSLPQNGNVKIQIAINDTLDGVVSANAGDSVFAYGQGYVTSGPWAGGIHDVHCSTHPTADNGWVVVNGTKHQVPAGVSRNRRLLSDQRIPTSTTMCA